MPANNPNVRASNKYAFTKEQKTAMRLQFQMFINALRDITVHVMNNIYKVPLSIEKNGNLLDAMHRAAESMLARAGAKKPSLKYEQLAIEFGKIKGFSRKEDWFARHYSGTNIQQRDKFMIVDIAALREGIKSRNIPKGDIKLFSEPYYWEIIETFDRLNLILKGYRLLRQAEIWLVQDKNSDITTDFLFARLNKISDIVRNVESTDAKKFPRIELLDKVVAAFRKALDLDSTLYEGVISELIFALKGTRHPERTIKDLKSTTRNPPAGEDGPEFYSFKQLFEFFYYPSFLTKQQIKNTIAASLGGKFTPEIAAKVDALDIKQLLRTLMRDIREHIENHGLSYRLYGDLGTQLTVDGKKTAHLAFIIYDRMWRALRPYKGNPTLLRLNDKIMAKLMHGTLTLHELQNTDDKNLFTYIATKPALPQSILDAWRQERDNQYHKMWNNREVYVKHMIEMLISQAGMMPCDPYGDLGKRVEYWTGKGNRHHIDFYKWEWGDPALRPTGPEAWSSWDFLLMGDSYHLARASTEPVKPLDYYSFARHLKNGFMHGRCPDYWSKRDKIFYYSRLYDMIKEWSERQEITQEWFKLNVPDKGVMTLKKMLKEKIINMNFVENIINIIIENIEGHGFLFDDSAFSDDNKRQFIDIQLFYHGIV